MLVDAGGNVAVQVGDDGPLLVDTPAGRTGGRRASARGPRRCRRSRFTRSSRPTCTTDRPATRRCCKRAAPGATRQVRVIAHENVLDRLVAAGPPRARPSAACALNPVIELPINNTYFTPRRDFYLNGEAIVALSRAGRAHRRRQHRPLPRLGRRGRGRPVQPRCLPGHRRGATAAVGQRPDRRAQPHPRDHRAGAVPGRRHLRDSAATAGCSDEAEVVEYPRHGDDRPRPRARPDREGPDARAGARPRGPRSTTTPSTAAPARRRPTRFVESVFRSLSANERRVQMPSRCSSAFAAAASLSLEAQGPPRAVAAARPPEDAAARRARRARRRRSISPATGCRSSPRTGAGAW